MRWRTGLVSMARSRVRERPRSLSGRAASPGSGRPPVPDEELHVTPAAEIVEIVAAEKPAKAEEKAKEKDEL